MSASKRGYLVKEPIHPHIFSNARRRFFVLAGSVLKWFVSDSQVGGVPRGQLLLPSGSRVERRGSNLAILTPGERPLLLRGDDLDGWRRAIEAVIAGPRAREGCREGGAYAAFVSHCKIDAAMEARYLQDQLEVTLGRPVFLDSDDLRDLTELQQHVRNSEALILVQSAMVLERPYCILELVTACDNGTPIVGVKLDGSAYDFTHAAAFLTHLDTALEQANPGAGKMLESLGVDLTRAAYKLANTIPQIISVKLDRSASRSILAATIADIVDAMRAAKRPALPDHATWLAARGEPPSGDVHPPTGGATAPRRHLGQAPAAVPPEVPTLPDSFLGRPDLTAALKQRVLHSNASASATALTAPAKKHRDASNTTAAAGMGGVGKTMTAAALARDDEVRVAFDKICWVSVGQDPDMLALQNVLHIQLTKHQLPEAAKNDARVGLEELKDASKGMSVLLVLDDVWIASHATPLNFVDGCSSRSAVVVTTRIRSLLDGAAEVKCTTLSMDASLELLLRVGGCEHLLGAPPRAAVEAVEMCGRLPLALGIAGGIMAELADDWQSELLPLLNEEFSQEASVEEAVVMASMRAMPQDLRASVEALFTLFAVFAEDAVVPTAAIDVVAPLMQTVGEAASKRLVRKCVKQLLKGNVIRGSIEDGVSVHDLVRDCMIRRADAAREGGLRTTQRKAVPLLLAAFDAGGPAANYVSSSLHWHVRQAQQPGVALQGDDVIMRVLTHESGFIRKQGVIGVGVDKLRAAADVCDKGGEHLEAAQLMWAGSVVSGNAAATELRCAWSSIKQLEAAGLGSSASRALESRVLNILWLTGGAGPAFGSEEHNEMSERIKELGRRPSVQGVANASNEAFDAEFGLSQAAAAAAHLSDNLSDYNGPMTREKVVQTHTILCEHAAHDLRAEVVAPDDALRMIARTQHSYATMFHLRPHALAEFSPVASFDVGGARLRETIQRYDFDQQHDGAKQKSNKIDVFSFGLEPLGLVLFFGDLTTARTGLAKVMDSHKRILARVRQGMASASEYHFEANLTFAAPAAALLLTNDFEMLRELIAHSLAGASFDDEAIRTGMQGWWQGPFGWKTEEGYCSYSFESVCVLAGRGLKALVEDDTKESRAVLRGWLPPPAELMRIAEFEVGLLTYCGANHPALLCARLHGERLDDWKAAEEVAEGVLCIEQFNPLLRTEAHRLLGRAKAERGERVAACEAAERAAAEARGAKYLWVEMLSLRDLLRWCEADEVESVRVRLRAVVARVASSREELQVVLGEDVVPDPPLLLS